MMRKISWRLPGRVLAATISLVALFATAHAQEWPVKPVTFIIPTSSSWLNLVERFFADITGDAIRRGVFRSVAELEEAILPAPGGFHVLLAGSGLVEYSRLTPEVRDQLMRIFETVKPRFDVVLIDTGAGISDVVLYAVSMAHEVIVLATPEPTSMTDAYATIKVLSAQQGREQMHMVVNQVGRSGDGRTICNQLQQVVERFVQGPNGTAPKLSFLGDIPLDSSVREAVQKRQLLMELHPGSAAAQGVVQVATRLQARG